MKLALGTVQFGLDYGVSNRDGQVPRAVAAEILARAQHHGVGMLDTAEAYGEAETVLGDVGIDGFALVGKIGRIAARDREEIAAEIRQRVEASLSRLGVRGLHGLLLHAPAQLLGEPAIAPDVVAGLQALRDAGLTSRIGVSCYGPGDAAALHDVFPFDIVQIPMSPIDRRWQDSGLLARFRAAGVEIHVRSVYLQGLLLMPVDDLPDWARPWRGLLSDWQDWARDTAGSPVAAALATTLADPAIDRAVIGVQTPGQLDEAVAALHRDVPALPDALRTTDPGLLDPTRWGKAA